MPQDPLLRVLDICDQLRAWQAGDSDLTDEEARALFLEAWGIVKPILDAMQPALEQFAKHTVEAIRVVIQQPEMQQALAMNDFIQQHVAANQGVRLA